MGGWVEKERERERERNVHAFTLSLLTACGLCIRSLNSAVNIIRSQREKGEKDAPT